MLEARGHADQRLCAVRVPQRRREQRREPGGCLDDLRRVARQGPLPHGVKRWALDPERAARLWALSTDLLTAR
ncbi:hypothetical protein [Pseudonocardia sp. WMMC193]|uniref:hypothetical protein n=1 Tax=Pseudonocardia sp. WMMC193 TaxID=2911965 RepID=UPI001F17D79F|nr:hypothetical protein [Pseudonocardia sp. WMMC193]MCF7550185.1 hypothetical protein [Pseudonocardia sp. WMMC193]